MLKKVIVSGLLIGIVLIFCTGLRAQLELPPNIAVVSPAGSSLATHEELVDFFVAWREFQAPKMFNGVPDYTQEAMARQHRELTDWQSRLAAIDTTGWSIAHQIDWYLVWAEMNGLDFAHRDRER